VEGNSNSLKEAYIKLRRLDYPDKDILIYADGEFNSFKGEILDQQPSAGEMVYQGDRITIVAAVSGICQMIPDLFTDYIGSSLSDVSNPRHNVKNLFAIFDSTFLKMLCRLEWIRDIYAGIYQSRHFVDYLNSVFFAPDSTTDKLDSELTGFILSKLSRFQGTESALQVFLESMTGLKVEIKKANNQRTPVPDSSVVNIGDNCKLGENIFLGEVFEDEKPELNIKFQLNNLEDVQGVIVITRDDQTIKSLLDYILPHYLKKWKITIVPNNEEIGFLSGNSFLGVSTTLNPGYHERS